MGSIQEFLDQPSKGEPKPLEVNPDVSPMQQWLANDDEARRLKMSLDVARQQDPDTTSRVLRMQTQTGLPKEFIEGNLDFVEKQTHEPTFDAERFRRSSPVVAGWFSEHPDHTAVAKDDAPQLGYLEKLVNALKRGSERLGQAWSATSIQGNVAALERMDPEYNSWGGPTGYEGWSAEQLAAWRGTLEADIVRRSAAIAQRQARINRLPQDPVVQSALESSTFADFWHFFSQKPVEFVATVGAESLPLMAPGLVLAVPAGVLGGVPAAALAVGAGSFSVDYPSTILSALAAEGVDLTNPDAIRLATQDRALMARVGEQAFRHAVPVAALDAISGGVAGRTLGGGLRVAQRPIARQGVNLAIQAPTQGVLGAAGEALGQVAAGQEVGAGEVMAEFWGEFAFAPLEVGALATARARSRYLEAARARERATFFAALGDTVKGSKTYERLPERLRELVDRLTKGGPVENLYLPVESFTRYFQDQGLDPRAIAQGLTGNVEAYDQAVVSGHDLVIPTADYATKIAPTDHNAFFVRELRLRPQEMNLREAEEWQKLAATEEPGLSPEEQEVQTAGQQVVQDITGQLLAAGFDPNVVEQYAALFESRYRTRAERRGLGESPLELFQALNLSVTRPVPEVLRTLGRGTTELDALLDRLRRGDMPQPGELYGPSLVEFLRAAGGVQDQGGELSHMAVDEAKAPFTRNLIQAQGLTLDEAALRAQEAGYLPERDINALLEAIDQETRGAAVYAPGREDPALAGIQENLESLARYLSELGIDVQAMTNEAIKAVLGEVPLAPLPVQGRTFLQDMARQATRTITRDALAAKGYDASVTFQPLVDAPGFSPQELANIFEGIALSPQGDRLLRIPSFAAMIAQMRRTALAEPQVLDTIVGAVSVDVVNDLFGSEAAAKVALHDEPVFKDGAAFDTELSIAQAVDASSPIGLLVREVALEAAKVTLVPSRPGVETAETLSALLARPVVRFRQAGPRRGKGPKAQITIGEGRISIELLEQADLSSFLHEVGHLYLDELTTDATTVGVPPELQQDLDTILKWVGLEVRVADGADAIKAAVGRQQHEQWARGFEAYTLEGKAPSQALREAFARFRQWLIQVYRLLTFRGGVTPEAIATARDVQLTPQVRAVMDRLLATEDEIQAAEREAQMAPLFTDAKSAGMSVAEFAAYQATVAQAGVEARDRLQARLMSQMRREQETWWQEQRALFRAEVERETNAQPVYIALSVIQKGTLPDGSPLPPELQPVKINAKAIAESMGKDFLKRLPRGIRSNKGITPDAAAPLFGFASGHDLMLAIVNARPRLQLIEAETDVRMRDEYGDMRFDGTIADEARAAVMNEAQEEMIVAELGALRRKQREVAPFIAAEREQGAGERRAARAQFESMVPPLAAVRSLATGMVGRQVVRTIKPSLYYNAARQASRRATDLLAAGDFRLAGEAKYRELLNMALFRAASNAQDEARSIREHMAELKQKKAQERIGKAGGDYLDQINELLERYEFLRIPLRVVRERQSLNAWMAEKEQAGETLGEEFAVPESVRNEARRINYQELTYDELLGVRDTVSQIEHFARLKNKLLKAKKKRDKEELREDLIRAIEANLEDKGPPPLTAAGLTSMQKASRLAQQFDALLIKMEQFVEWLDGGPTGPWHDAFWYPAVDAQAAENDATKTITAKIAQAVVGIPTSIRDRMLDTVSIQGIEAVVTRKDLIGAALNTGNESNYQKLLKGMGWTPDQVKEMTDLLTQEEWQFVQSIWDTLEGMWPDIAALQKRLTGIEPVKVEVRPVVTKFGEFRGGYYPLMYSSVLSEQGQLQLASTFGKLLDNNYTRATLPSGYRKARVEGFARAFDLDIDRLPSHIAGVVKDLTHREWLIDANWIANDPGIRAVLQRHVGDPATLRMNDWVRQVVNDRNNQSMSSLGVWQRMIEHFRFNTTIVAMGFKASTMISQLAGVAPAIEVVGAKWWAKGVVDALAHPRASYDFMTHKSGEMRHRIRNRDRDMRDLFRTLEGRSDMLAQLQEFSLMAIGYSELMVSMPTWLGAYQKALQAGSSDEEAVRAGDRAVRLSQGAAGAKDLAAIAARSDQLTLVLTMFYTPFSALYGRLRDIGHQFGGVKDVPKAVLRLFWTVVVAATLGELASGRTPDEDKDEDWLTWWLQAVATYPFLAVPLMRDAVATVTKGYGYQFTPLAQAIETLASTVRTAKQVARDEKEWTALAEKAVKAFSYLVGLPSSQIMITGDYLWDLHNDDAEADNIFEFAHDFLYKRPKED